MSHVRLVSVLALLMALPVGGAPRGALAAATPYHDSVIFSAPSSGGSFGYLPSAHGGPTDYPEIHVVREQAFDAQSGAAPAEGLSTDLYVPGFDAADDTLDGLYAQSIYVRAGPVKWAEHCSPNGFETIYDISFSPGLRIAAVLGRHGQPFVTPEHPDPYPDPNYDLYLTDPLWGVAGLNYAADARGLEHVQDTFTISDDQTTLQVKATYLCESGLVAQAMDDVDDIRILVDHGAAFRSAAFMTVTLHQDACNEDGPCGADVNVGPHDGNADPHPDQNDELVVRIPLTSVEAAGQTAAPVLQCPIAPGAVSLAGTVAAPRATQVTLFAYDGDNDALFVLGSTSVAEDETFTKTLAADWPWPLQQGFHVWAQAVAEDAGQAPSDLSPIVVVGDADCDGSPPELDCDDADPTTYPGASEICADGIDQDCNGTPDDNCPNPCVDADGDGYGDGFGCQASDCDDQSALCTLQCEDEDENGVFDCRQDCFDPDHDGFGLGSGCLGPDCDETSLACNADCADSDRDGRSDCEDDCIDGDQDGAGAGSGCVTADCQDHEPYCTTDCSDLDEDSVADCAQPNCESEEDCAPGHRCDLVAGRCVECLADDDCTAASCEPDLHLCVPLPCVVDEDCGAANCDLNRRICVAWQCEADSDCVDATCNAERHVCIPWLCRADSDCCSAGSPCDGWHCQTEAHACALSCQTTADCQYADCDPLTGTCVPWSCQSDDQCPGQRCDPESHTCTSSTCLSDADCDGTSHCEESHCVPFACSDAVPCADWNATCVLAPQKAGGFCEQRPLTLAGGAVGCSAGTAAAESPAALLWLVSLMFLLLKRRRSAPPRSAGDRLPVLPDRC